MQHDRELTLSATAFKAQCLDIMTRIAAHKLSRVTVTKRGKPVAVMGPAETADDQPKQDLPRVPACWGVMRGTLAVPEGMTLDEVFDEMNDYEMPGPDLSKFDRFL